MRNNTKMFWFITLYTKLWFDKINGFIRVYDGTRYLVLLVPEKYDATCNRIRYLIGVKSGITYVISHYYVKIKVYSYDSLPLEKKLTFHNVIVFINSILNKNKNIYFYNMFFKKRFVLTT